MSTFLPIGTWLASRQYRIIKHIGEGGFGKTYLVENRLGEKKVVKEFFISSMCTREASNEVTISIEENKTTFEQQREKFEQEALKIFSLKNPHIVKVSAVFDENNTIYYVMDYIEGGSLNDKLKSIDPLPEAQIQRYLGQILDALEYVHTKGMMHLDIKPSNIMLDANNNVVLIDFGASKVFDSSMMNKTINTTRPPYTPGYAPYEQENGDVKYLGTHCDIYSLGATLYRLYSGNKPPMPIEILMNGLTFPSSVPTHMQQAIKKAMTFKMDERIKTVSEFRREIGLLGDAPTTRIDNNKTIVAEAVDDKTEVAPSKPESPKLESFTETVNGVSFRMIAVEGSTFKMGAQSSDPNGANFDPDAFDDECPVHDVSLDSFYLAEFVVTEDLWNAVMDGNKSHESKGGLLKRLFGDVDGSRVGYPKTNISWDDCQEFIRELNQLTGKNFSLPTEAQWEYAARGGNKSRGYRYSGSNSLKDVAWCFVNAWTSKAVGTKMPNELGIYDMSGNVCEWCADLYDRKYYSRPECQDMNPENQSIGTNRVFRGGGWYSNEQNCRISIRNKDRQSSRLEVGFRLALCL